MNDHFKAYSLSRNNRLGAESLYFFVTHASYSQENRIAESIFMINEVYFLSYGMPIFKDSTREFF